MKSLTLMILSIGNSQGVALMTTVKENRELELSQEKQQS